MKRRDALRAGRSSYSKQVEREIRPQTRGRRILHLSVLCGVIAFICLYLDGNNYAFDALERQSVSLRMAFWARRNNHTVQESRRRIVIVPVSDETFNHPSFASLDGPPVPRDYHARVISELKRAGVGVIAFDLLFDIPREPDRKFAAAARSSGRVVWACLWDNENKKLLLPNQQLRNASPFLGHTRTPHGDQNRTIERFEVAIKSGGKFVPALSVQTVSILLGKPLSTPAVTNPAVRWRIGDVEIPTRSDQTFRINFVGAPGDAFPVVPYELIYSGAANQGMYRDNKFFKDKVVLIGDVTALNRDYYMTPVGHMTGVEVHAHAVATLLVRSFLTETSNWSGPVIMVCLIVAACLISAVCRWLTAAAAVGGLLAGFFLLSVWLFIDSNLIIPTAMPAIAALVAAIVTIIERGWTEERARARMKLVLDHYVGAQVGTDGPPTGELALVFTDLEGSSDLARRFGEQFEPVRDRHFEILRAAVHKWDGFEVETAGDSLYAVFRGASDAVRFAVEAQNNLQQHIWPTPMGAIRVRIGIHYGKPFIGLDRMRFTFRGHETNRTARVMSKAQGGQTLVTEELRKVTEPDLPPTIAFRQFGVFELKGTGEETLYEVVDGDLAGDTTTDQLSPNP